MRSFACTYKHTQNTFDMLIEICILSFQLLDNLFCRQSVSKSTCLPVCPFICKFSLFSLYNCQNCDKFHKKLAQSRIIRILIVNIKDKPIFQRKILVITENQIKGVILKATFKNYCIRNDICFRLPFKPLPYIRLQRYV